MNNTLTYVYVLCTYNIMYILYTRCVHVLLKPTIPISVELVFNKTLLIIAFLKLTANGVGHFSWWCVYTISVENNRHNYHFVYDLLLFDD